MADDLPQYEIFAIRYATRPGVRSAHFIGGDPHDGPMPMDYFVWVVRGDGRLYVVDLGYTEEMAKKRERQYLRCPIESLKLIGIDPQAVEEVVVTHLHYDHVGNFHKLPNAKFHLQEPEAHFAAGRHMKYPHLAHNYEVEDIVAVVRLNFGKRVIFHNGRHELAPGISLIPAPGHSPGLQIARVNTARGWVVLASDVTHFYENFETGRPFAVAHTVPDMLESFDKLYENASSPDHIIPGHDPLVTKIYPGATPELEGIVMRLDVPPRRRNA